MKEIRTKVCKKANAYIKSGMNRSAASKRAWSETYVKAANLQNGDKIMVTTYSNLWREMVTAPATVICVNMFGNLSLTKTTEGAMKKKTKKSKKNSVQELMGVRRFTQYGLQTDAGELVFFRVAPTNISVLSHENIELKIRHLQGLLSMHPDGQPVRRHWRLPSGGGAKRNPTGVGQ